MASLIDLVVATGLFFVFVALILGFVLSYYSSFLSVLQESELRTQAANVDNIFFGGKGVPEDWDTRNTTPARIGLLNDLYRTPFIITTTNATDVNNVTLNFTINFDPLCLNKTRETTIRVYNATNAEFPYTLYNKTFCVANTYVKKADFALNFSLRSLTPYTFFVYYSPEAGINATGYGNIVFPSYNTPNNLNITYYPTESLRMVSPSKLRALRNLTYSQVAQTLGSNTRFQLEVDSP